MGWVGLQLAQLACLVPWSQDQGWEKMWVFPVVWPDMGGANPPSISNRFIAVLLSVFVGGSLQPHSVWDQRYQEMLGIGNYPGFWLSPGHWLC